MTHDRKIILISILIIIATGFVVYANSLDGQFIWDDEFLIERNLYVHHWNYWPKFFTQDIGAGAGNIYGFYRPVLMLSLAADYALWKLNVKGYHVTTVMLHIFVALSIYWLITILFDNRMLSFLTGMLFLVHPVQCEDVAYITGRADSLVLLFMLLALISYIWYIKNAGAGSIIIMLVCFVAALLSKENAVIFPGFILIYHFVFREKVRYGIFLATMSITALYIGVRVLFTTSTVPYSILIMPVFKRIPGFFVAFMNYFRLLLIPSGLHSGYGHQVFSYTDPRTIAGFIIFLLVLWVALLRRGKSVEIRFAALWFLTALAPVSNTIFPASNFMAVRYLYIPSIGFFLVIAYIIQYLYRKEILRTGVIIFSVGLLVFYSILTIRHNEYWSEPITFYEMTLRHEPKNATIYNNLGICYAKAGRTAEAALAFKKSIRMNPLYAKAYNNLGNLFGGLGKKDEAIVLFAKAIKLVPDYVEAYNNLGVIYKDLERYKEAEQMFVQAISVFPQNADISGTVDIKYAEDYIDGSTKKALRFNPPSAGRGPLRSFNPNHALAYYNLGGLYTDMDMSDKAITAYDKALAINPSYVKVYNELANIYRQQEKYQKAIELYTKAVGIDPLNADAHNNLGIAYDLTGNREKAITCFENAAGISPYNTVINNNLGDTYQKTGKYEEAESAYRKVIRINPDNIRGLKALGTLYTEMGKTDEATVFFERIVTLNPDDGGVYNNLAIAYYFNKEYGQAVKNCDKAIEMGYEVHPGFIEALRPYRE